MSSTAGCVLREAICCHCWPPLDVQVVAQDWKWLFIYPEQGIAVTQACQTLARAAREMVIFAFDNAGTSAVYARSPIQRCLRDIFAGMKHASFTPAMLGRIGKVRLGLPFGGAPL